MNEIRLFSLSRYLLGATFLLSGFVKAVDPHGTEYKIEDYIRAFGLSGYLPEWLPLLCSLILAATEFMIGLCLMIKAHDSFMKWVSFAMMCIMTPLTLWLAIDDPVSDCGCFGDAIVLSNWETFGKNIVLLACSVALLNERTDKTESSRLLPIPVLSGLALIILVEWWGIYHLPLIDFRPYRIGTDIREGMRIPQDAPRAEYETTFLFKKNGVERVFTLDNYPDSTWAYISTNVKLVKEGYVPPIHDFVLTDVETGDDITDSILTSQHVYLVLSKDIDKTDIAYKDKINNLFAKSIEDNADFYFVTASVSERIGNWKIRTDANYRFCQMDATTLKTILRSTTGVLELKHGIIVDKKNIRDY